jgi:hypothetical protein
LRIAECEMRIENRQEKDPVAAGFSLREATGAQDN